MFPQQGGQGQGGSPTVWENLLNFLFSRGMLKQTAQQGGVPPVQQQQVTPPAQPAYNQQDMMQQNQAYADALRRQEALKQAILTKGSR